ncbi:rifin [Plasmodium reichenowi]|uniref:Rifin n=1 Tax=Plasmodium reichenowi TaxID=5854 RepID=A0A060RQL1_PLARE|nr:rifin [Plasmodium reichenowi]
MKVNYINILLFALPLNILVYNKRNHYITTSYTQTNRSLCECELYAPANYDSDSQMKEVMDNFSKQTQQRFHEYDERMKTTRQKCKDKCDKEIQKIILKDKLEKQMAQQLDTLETKIDTNDIPTCVCEKSLADKVEKGCLRCGYGLGTVAPTVGLLGTVAIGAWKNTAIAAATKAAIAKGAAKGLAAGNTRGMEIVIYGLKHFGVDKLFNEIYQSILKIDRFTDLKNFAEVIIAEHKTTCSLNTTKGAQCIKFDMKVGIRLANGEARGPPAVQSVPKMIKGILEPAEKTAEEVTKSVTKEATEAAIKTNTGVVEAATTPYYTTIIASIIAIVVIVLIMVIIYKILRYRRKKKMKKKLQYIKLLEE